jgi:hypothetical protein
MSAPLIFVRDGRTLPFVPVTQAALAAIAERVPVRRRAYARSLYLALLELTNEARDVRAEVSRKRLGERAGCSPDLVSDLSPLLVEAGVVEVHERMHGGERQANEWVVVEPSGSPDPRGSQPLPPVAASHDRGGSQPRQQREQETTTENTAARTRAHEVPPDFPDHLRQPLAEVMAHLTFAAEARGAPAPSAGAVARAMVKRPRKPHELVAERVAHWLVYGNGRRAQCRDLVARWRDWLDAEDDVQPVTSGRVLYSEAPVGVAASAGGQVVRMGPRLSEREARLQRQERRMQEARAEGLVP